MAMEVVQEEIGDGNMQCTNHPYKNSAPGGICAFCLQEKLGKLVSSSFSVAFLPSSSSSSSPSFRSELGGGGASAFQARRIAASSSSSSVNSHQVKGNDCAYNGYSSSSSYNIRRSRLPFVLTQKKKTKKDGAMAGAGADSGSIVFKRSKSTATPRRGGIMHFMDARNYSTNEDNNSRRRFWSFLYMSNSNSKQQQHSGSGKKSDNTHSKESNFTSSTRGVAAIPSREKSFVVVEENESPDEAAFDRKVSRSRSVGCGSRSFSGDLFERISNGFGDCTLRRVESQREGKVKPPHSSNRNGNGSSASSSSSQDCIKERVRCGGIFSGFIITSSSSSSSSSSYLVSEENNNNVNVNGNGKASASSSTITSVKNVSHGRSRSWGWALASPIRALGKTSSGKRAAAAAAAAGVASNKNPSPNLAAIPSLLTVSG